MTLLLAPCQARLVRSITAALEFDREVPTLIVESIETVPWNSLTFAGSDHRLVVHINRISRAELEKRLAHLCTLHTGEVVADARITGSQIGHRRGTLLLAIEVLTVDGRRAVVGDTSPPSSTSAARTPRRRTPLANHSAPRMT